MTHEQMALTELLSAEKTSSLLDLWCHEENLFLKVHTLKV